MSVIEAFQKTRAKYINEIEQQNNFGNSGKNFRNNELEICGDKNVGMTMGVFIADSNEQTFRVIKGFRSLRISKEIAEKYDIKNHELRLCNSDQYLNATPEEKKLIDALNAKLEQIEKNWDAWDGKISKYPPRYVESYTIQYMKVLQKLDAKGTPVEMDPGVKVIKAKAKGYLRAFDSYIESLYKATGGYEFLNDFIERTNKHRTQKYILKVSRPKFYEFVFSSVAQPVEITDEDLETASDLYKEVVDVTRVNSETLKKWGRMINAEYNEIKNKVEGKVETPAPVQPEPAPEPVKAEPVAEEDDDNPFA